VSHISCKGAAAIGVLIFKRQNVVFCTAVVALLSTPPPPLLATLLLPLKDVIHLTAVLVLLP
jgi:hypothetical protein